MKFDDLPDHIISNIFNYLTVGEVKSIIPYLSGLTNLLAIERLYCKHIILVNNENMFHENEPTLDIRNFQSLLEQEPFISYPTKDLSILFDMPDHNEVDFVVNKLFRKYHFYINNIAEIDVTIAQCDTLMTKPYYILQILINMTDTIATHITSLSFGNCLIGSFRYPWHVFFNKFENLQRLSLKSCGLNDGATILNSIQVLPFLKHLDLGDNSLKSISFGFVNNLPKSLVSLSLENNGISGFHIPYLNVILPNLYSFNLSNSSKLRFINCNNFTKACFELDIRNTKLDRLSKRHLIEQSQKIGFTILDGLASCVDSNDEYSDTGSEIEFYQSWSD